MIWCMILSVSLGPNLVVIWGGHILEEEEMSEAIKEGKVEQGSNKEEKFKEREAKMDRWSEQEAGEWYRETGVIRGCNYLPRTAINSTETW